MMDSIPIFRSAGLWPIAHWISERGLPLARHREAVGISELALQDPNLIIPERLLWELLDRLHRIEGIDDIGFRIGNSHRVTDVHGLPDLLVGQHSLQELLQAFCSKLKAHANHWDYRLIRAKGGVHLRRRSSPFDVGKWPVEQYVVSYLINLVRMAAPQSWHPSEIWLQHRGYPLHCERTWLAAAKVHFNSPCTAIYIPQRLLALPLRSQIECSESTPNYSELGKSITADMRQLLKGLLTGDQHRIANVAHLVGTTPRTLQRALYRYGTSYQQLLNGARFDLAREKLMDGHLSITEVAYDIGFSEVASFSKAFRKWAGVSPREYRASSSQEC